MYDESFSRNLKLYHFYGIEMFIWLTQRTSIPKDAITVIYFTASKDKWIPSRTISNCPHGLTLADPVQGIRIRLGNNLKMKSQVRGVLCGRNKQKLSG